MHLRRRGSAAHKHFVFQADFNNRDMTPVEFRRHLHAQPELSFEERQTARFISEELGIRR